MMVSVATFGSTELQEAYEAFVGEVREFEAFALTFGQARNLQADISGFVEEMNTHRRAARDALRKIEWLIRDELAA